MPNLKSGALSAQSAHRSAALNLLAYPGNFTMSKVQNWVAHRHWWLIALVAVLLIFLESLDFSSLRSDPIHLTELLIYLLMLLIIGILYDSSFRAMKFRNKMNKIIDYKHKLSLEFSIYNDWDVLVTQLARFPGTITEVEHSSLYVSDPFSNLFELVALKDNAGFFLKFSQCGPDGLPGSMLPDAQTFCLPIRYGEGLLGVIGFKLKDGQKLTPDQQDIFRNIGDELGLALKVGQDRKIHYEMSASETTLAERRRVSHYLHDHLGHNLGYLHFKLDQLINNKDQLSLESVLADLEHMRKAADDSYEIVRGTLESMQPETTPMLTNLLLEHARKVSKRANIEIDFQNTGKQIPLAIDIKRVIFYVFEEALSNAEKHAQASKINVLTEWGQDAIALTIADNGVGFAPEEVNTDQHFGLEILRERLEQVGGQVSLVTAEKLGTTVSVRVPIPVLHQIGGRL
jgi:signal transduction histidine kinase